jgi:uridine kinase
MLASERPVTLSIDSYYRDLSPLDPRERAARNFDSPDAIDLELLVSHLESLARGRSVQKPVYDFTTHTRLPRTITLSPGDVLIIEGLFPLYWPEVRALLDTKVFVELPDQLALARRLERDVRERGRTRESVLDQFYGTVRPMAEKYVIPTKSFADVVVSGADPVERSVSAIIAHIESASRRM